ncbi:MAG: aldehyde ferredoxin oxidoreductase family protein [Chloroflexota bacterium]
MTFLGRILEVDLESGRSWASAYPEDTAHQFLAGRGFNSLYLRQNVGPEVDPLDEANPLLFACGLLTGTEAPASSRLQVSARSPLTGLLGSSNVGGHFGAALRAAGWQALIVHGRAPAPVFLSLGEDSVEVRDAADLESVDAWRTQEAVRAQLDAPKARIMAIGRGGENAVRYACIMTERGHAAGRTGMGAVMGSKNLKAVAVTSAPRPVTASAEAREAIRAYAEAVRSAPRYPTYARFSNSGFVIWANDSGILATRNYRANHLDGAASIDGKRLIEYVTKAKSCHRCPVHCKAEVRIASCQFAGLEGERPDIEPIVALGSKCGVDDPEAVLYLYNLCGRLGLDVISAASCLAFAMDLRERGIVTAADTDDVDLVWGDHKAMATMLGRIAEREGFGAVLAEGVARAAAIIGGGADVAAYHSKGLELTAYDPRGGQGTALGYAVSARGGDFTSVYAVPEYRWDAAQGEAEFGTPLSVDRFSPVGKPALVRRTICVSAALDALGLCKVPALSVVGDFSLSAEARLASALAGWEMTAADLLTVGERVNVVERLFNLRMGLTSGADDLPAYFRAEGLPEGPGQGATVDVRPLVGEFYTAMGWDERGCPTAERLCALGIQR